MTMIFLAANAMTGFCAAIVLGALAAVDTILKCGLWPHYLYGFGRHLDLTLEMAKKSLRNSSRNSLFVTLKALQCSIGI